jgi:hypothetical protein
MLKVGFGVALLSSLLLAGLKWLIPSIPLEVVISPFAILVVLIAIEMVLQILFELFKMVAKLAAFMLLIYMLYLLIGILK